MIGKSSAVRPGATLLSILLLSACGPADETESVSRQESALGTYVGCYTDEPNRALPALQGTGHTVDSCVAVARTAGFRYAGLQASGECWTGNDLGYAQVSDAECNMPCAANPAQSCGGLWRNSIYDTNDGGSGNVAALYESGRTKYYAQDYPGAIGDLGQVVTAWPDHFDARYLLGMSYRKVEDWSNAITHFTYLLDHFDPLDCEVRFQLGYAYMKAGRVDLGANVWDPYLRSPQCYCHPSYAAACSIQQTIAGMGGGAGCSVYACQNSDPPNNAGFTQQVVPTSMSPGGSYTVRVDMRNLGSNDWTAAQGYKLGSQSPQDNSTWGLTRVELLSWEEIEDDEWKVFTFVVTAPQVPGTYPFQWRMLQEGVEWFGASTPTVLVNVQ